jgi:hypothetical protein
MGNLNSKVRNNNTEWRKDKVLELISQGNNQSEISRIMQIANDQYITRC